MGLLQNLIQALRGPTPQVRDVPDDVFDTATVRVQAGWGGMDRGRPTEQQVRDNNRGVFSEFVGMRAKGIGRVLADATVVRALPDGTSQEVEIEHPWRQLIRRPNPHRARIDIWRWVSMMRDLSGPADFVVERGPLNIPIGLHEVFPVFGQMVPIPDGMGGIASWLFERSDGQRIPLAVDDVIRIRHPDPISPYETQSLMERAAYELDKRTYSDLYSRDMMKEGRVPPFLLETDQALDQMTVDSIRTRFKKFQMASGEFRGVPILTSGLKAKTISLDAKQLALTEVEQLTDTHLFWLCGIPQGMYSESANRANANAARFVFAVDTIMPEAESVAGQLTIAFERIFGAEPGVLEIRVPDSVPVDEYEQSQIDERRIRSGLRTINEVRERDGEDPVDGGDQVLVPLGLMPLAAKPPEPERSFREAGRPAVATDVARVGGRAGDDEDAEAWKKIDKARRAPEAALDAAARSYLTSQADTVIARLYEIAGGGRSAQRADLPPSLSVESLFDLAFWQQLLASDLAPLIEAAMAAGYDFAGVAFDLTGTIPLDAPEVVRILAKLADKTKSVPRTMMDELDPIIEQAIRDRVSLDELAGRIRQHYDEVTPWKAHQIAQTTSTGAFEGGQIQMFIDGGATKKRWLEQGDDRVRDSHRALGGVVVGVTEKWTVPGTTTELAFPGDPDANDPSAVVGCRCSMLPVP
jgi:hypothetical protein